MDDVLFGSLKDGWQLSVLDDDKVTDEIRTSGDIPSDLVFPSIPASVPGDWILDYVHHGDLADPFFGDNLILLRRYEICHQVYTLTFTLDEAPTGREFFRFEGIDTVADIYLNGQKLGHAENMFVEHEFDAISLKQGRNELLVHIFPVELEARKYPIYPGDTSASYNEPSLVIRKATHAFGWDICPRIVTAGIWRKVSLLRRKPIRLNSHYLAVQRFNSDGDPECYLMFDACLQRESVFGYSVRFSGRLGDFTFSREEKLWHTRGSISNICLPRKTLWYPKDYGPQNLFDFKLELLRNGETVDTLTWRQGIRKVTLERDDMIENDASPAKFQFLVNNQKIFIKGSNWVPASAYHSQDHDRIPSILDLIDDEGCNAIRVWGGGVYEDDLLYDICDEKGILVWQDFMMACKAYPQTEQMQKLLYDEAQKAVCRIRHHACLLLYSGDNECDVTYRWAGMAEYRDPNSNVLTRKVLPAVLAEQDPYMPYLPSSPYISEASYLAGKYESTPEQHLWGPRNYFKSPFYHDHHATFASEIGYHGCASPQSLKKFIPKDHLWPALGDRMWRAHAASAEPDNPDPNTPNFSRITLMFTQVHAVFQEEPDHLEQFARMSQICQAEAKKYFIESFRSRKGERTGIIWWNEMDCWPQLSDAVVDYYFCRKLAYHFIKRSQAPLCFMIDDHPGTEHLYVVSDLMTEKEVSYRVEDVETKEVLAQGTVRVPADSLTDLGPVSPSHDPAFVLMTWTENGKSSTNHYLFGKPRYAYSWYTKCLKAAGYDQFEGF